MIPLSDTPDRPFLGVVRSASGRIWLPRVAGATAQTALAIAQRHGLPEIIARVLAGRGVGVDEAAHFLEPTLRALMPDPSTLTDMDRAVERIARAVIDGEKIAIFADYDVDGATSASVLCRLLTSLGTPPVVYVPDRITEGYGPNAEAIRRLGDQGARLIITVDCGATSHEAFAGAKAGGLDIVALDHHPAGESLPPAEAIVDPNRQDDLSGQGHLAAVGVTYLTAVGLCRLLRQKNFFSKDRPPPDLLALLDLVALGTVCDVVPLVGLNRAFVVKGLEVMKLRHNPGLTALSDVARLGGPPSAYHLGFLIGPRINAGGRIGDAGLGARLLSCDDRMEAERIAALLDRLNGERQAIEQAALAEAETIVAVQGETPVLVVSGEGWHPGIVGLVASRLKERHRRPAIAIGFDETGRGIGSGRSVPGVDLGAAIRAAAETGLLLKGGGHAMAAGLTVMKDRLAELSEFLDTRLEADVTVALANRALKLDSVVTAGGAKHDLVTLIEKAGPYGAGHPEPLFALPGHRIADSGIVGQGHVRATFVSPDNQRLEAIAFRAAEEPVGELLLGRRGGNVHVAGALQLNHFGATPRVQLRILDAADPADCRD
ncbi:single-stranded-DNA-specific exonuclease RecJ [Segnochrobactraceae bacterium EtOH-i3]